MTMNESDMKKIPLQEQASKLAEEVAIANRKIQVLQAQRNALAAQVLDHEATSTMLRGALEDAQRQIESLTHGDADKR